MRRRCKERDALAALRVQCQRVCAPRAATGCGPGRSKGEPAAPCAVNREALQRRGQEVVHRDERRRAIECVAPLGPPQPKVPSVEAPEHSRLFEKEALLLRRRRR